MYNITVCRPQIFILSAISLFRTVDASFQFYGQLEFVDFSNNQMAELPDRCFAKQSKVQSIY